MHVWTAGGWEKNDEAQDDDDDDVILPNDAENLPYRR
jgi:hypothetical protein